MVSLLDIVPQTRAVQIADGELILRGLGLRQIADLLLRFPSLRKRVFDRAPLDINELILAAPDAAGAIIAEAAGQPEAADQVSDRLAIADAVECLLAVCDLTMPNGIAPFFERLGRLLDGAADLVGKAPAMSLPKRPNGSSPADMIQPE